MFSKSFAALVVIALTTFVDAAPTRQYLICPLHEEDIANFRSRVLPPGRCHTSVRMYLKAGRCASRSP